jgi:3-oxoacyl-[acyl-carrier-protein] synthase-3
MARLSFNHVRIAALACVVPEHVQYVNQDPDHPRAAYHRSFIKKIGISKRHISVTGQTCTDTGFAAAQQALKKAGITAEELDAVICMSQTPDFDPGACNAFQLHNRLGMKNEAFAFDIPMACASFAFGLSVCAGYLQQQGIHKLLMVSGDTQWAFYKSREQLEHDDVFLCGEATTALILDDTGDERLALALFSDGSGYKYLFDPTCGARNRWGQYEFDLRNPGGDPGSHEIMGRYMDGLEITSFSTTTVVNSLRQFMQEQGTGPESYDGLVLHQANKQIVSTIGRRLGFDKNKVPMSLERYANTDGASIPVTMVDAYHDDPRDSLHLLCSGFGTGLSWGIADLTLNPSVIVPVTEISDGRFCDDVTHIRKTEA